MPLVRADLPPPARAVLTHVAGTLDEARMQAMNAAAADYAAVRRVAGEYHRRRNGRGPRHGSGAESVGPVGREHGRHLTLVLAALVRPRR